MQLEFGVFTAYGSGVPFRPIVELKDLPVIGDRREDLNLDFKATVVSTPAAELAKDVAAFANASGGTILIGAQEDKKTNALQGFVPLSAAEAAAARKNFAEAVPTRCDPAPVFDSCVIERESGKFVVAVNVWPHPLLPVAVRAKTNKALEGSEWDAWLYFVRVGTDTIPLTPVQAATLMIPKIRNTLTLLESIPVNQRNKIRIAFRMPQLTPVSDQAKVTYVEMLEIRLLENVAVLKSVRGYGGHNSVPVGRTFHLPLSEILGVWSLFGEHGWCISVNGQFNENFGPFQYVPNT